MFSSLQFFCDFCLRVCDFGEFRQKLSKSHDRTSIQPLWVIGHSVSLGHRKLQPTNKERARCRAIAETRPRGWRWGGCYLTSSGSCDIMALILFECVWKCRVWPGNAWLRLQQPRPAWSGRVLDSPQARKRKHIAPPPPKYYRQLFLFVELSSSGLPENR